MALLKSNIRVVDPNDGMISMPDDISSIPFPLAPRKTNNVSDKKAKLKSLESEHHQNLERLEKIPIPNFSRPIQIDEPKHDKENEQIGDENPSLLLRYRDVPDYPENSYAPKDFDYHSVNSCGPRGTGSIHDAFRANGIICDFDDYAQYGPSYLAEPEIKSQITSARKKACRCEVERRLTSENRHNLEDVGDHVYPLKRAIAMCKQCAQIERDLYKHGYLKNKREIEKDDAIVRLLLEVYALYTSGEQLWKNQEGITRFDKILRFLWLDYLPADSILKNLKKAMTFNEFKRSFAAIDIYLEEMLLRAQLNSAIIAKGKSLKLAEAKRQRLNSIEHTLKSKKNERHRVSKARRNKSVSAKNQSV